MGQANFDWNVASAVLVFFTCAATFIYGMLRGRKQAKPKDDPECLRQAILDDLIDQVKAAEKSIITLETHIKDLSNRIDAIDEDIKNSEARTTDRIIGVEGRIDNFINIIVGFFSKKN